MGVCLKRGHDPGPATPEVFSDIDVLVVPSQYNDNNTRVIQDTFTNRTPVIASNVDGISVFVITRS